jgi:hypothetical protein
MTAQPSHRTDQRTTEPRTEPTERPATVEAAVSLRVPRGAMGDLPTGVREVLAAVTGVEAVDVGEIRAVRPTSFDIHVDLTARLGMDETTDPDAVRERLLDGFGIEAVEAVVLDVG